MVVIGFLVVLDSRNRVDTLAVSDNKNGKPNA